MAKLIYSAQASLDGYTVDAAGSFDWAAPDTEVHTFINDLERPIGTYLFGRRMYETMAVWETIDLAEEPTPMTDFAAIWRGADKIVFSSSLEQSWTARTRIERTFDPGAIETLKEGARANLSIGGAHLAAQALAHGLVDELHLFFYPVCVGGGTRALPDGVRLELELLEERRFVGGVIHSRYAILR